MTRAKIAAALLAAGVAGIAIAYLLMTGWMREDAAEVCGFMGYTGYEIEHGVKPKAVCVLSLPGVTVRHEVSLVYRKYVRELRRKAAVK